MRKPDSPTLPSTMAQLPRIAECRSHFECEVEWTKQWLHRLMVVGKVVAASVDEGCVDEQGLSRLGKVEAGALLRSRIQDQVRRGLSTDAHRVRTEYPPWWDRELRLHDHDTCASLETLDPCLTRRDPRSSIRSKPCLNPSQGYLDEEKIGRTLPRFRRKSVRKSFSACWARSIFLKSCIIPTSTLEARLSCTVPVRPWQGDAHMSIWFRRFSSVYILGRFTED